jgi:hypothetical protein
MSSVFIIKHSYPSLKYSDYLPYRNRHVVETKCVALEQDKLSMHDQVWGPLLVSEYPLYLSFCVEYNLIVYIPEAIN